MKKTVTLSVNEALYDAAKKAGLKPSELLDIALKIALDVQETIDEKELELVIKRKMLEEQREKVLSSLVSYRQTREAIDHEIWKLECMREQIESQLRDVEVELRLSKLQMYISRLRTFAIIYAYRKEEMEKDEDVNILIDQIKKLRPDFQLEKYLDYWELLDKGGGI